MSVEENRNCGCGCENNVSNNNECGCEEERTVDCNERREMIIFRHSSRRPKSTLFA